MSKILFIAPHSFPIISSESICNAKLAVTLANSGYKIDVYTCRISDLYPADDNLLKPYFSNPNLQVYYCPFKHILSKKNPFFTILFDLLINLKILLKTGYFYNGISISYNIVKEINRNIRKQGMFDYDTIITRGFFTDYVGIYFAKKYKIKWISNWNDPYPSIRFPKPYGTGFDTKLPFLEMRVINDIQKYSSKMTFPSDRLRDYMLLCFPKFSKGNTEVIPHMAYSKFHFPKYSQKDKVLKIVHSGSVKSPRSPKLFLNALYLIGQEIELKNKLVCYFVGGYDEYVKDLIIQLNLQEIVHLLPPMQYSESLEFISKCNLSLIIEAECEEGIYLPTKFVDSLQVGNPLFCISPQIGTLHDLLIKYKIGYFADNTDLKNIKSTLYNIIKDFSNNKIPKFKQTDVEYFFEQSIISKYREILS